MKKNRGLFGVVIAVILIGITMLASDFFASRASGYFYDGVIAVSPESHYEVDCFSVDDYHKMQRLKDDWMISYEAREKATLSFANQNFESEVLYTNREYFQMVYIPLAHGTYLPEGRNHTIVLSEELALRIFGYTNAIGKTLTIGAEPYLVVGVAKNQGEMAWLEWNGDVTAKNISRLYWMQSGVNKLDAFAEIDTIIKTFGNSNTLYQITDLDSYTDAFHFRNRLFLCVIEIAAVTVVWISVCRYFKTSVKNGIVFTVITTIMPIIATCIYLYKLASIFNDLQYFKSEHFDFLSLVTNTNININHGVFYETNYLRGALGGLVSANAYQLISQSVGVLAVILLIALSAHAHLTRER